MGQKKKSSSSIPSHDEFQKAIDVVGEAILVDVHLPPILALNIQLIHRCLVAGRALFAAMEKRGKKIDVG
jgi:hypothetical protein